jgi:hypothetical protein
MGRPRLNVALHFIDYAHVSVFISAPGGRVKEEGEVEGETSTKFVRLGSKGGASQHSMVINRWYNTFSWFYYLDDWSRNVAVDVEVEGSFEKHDQKMLDRK